MHQCTFLLFNHDINLMRYFRSRICQYRYLRGVNESFESSRDVYYVFRYFREYPISFINEISFDKQQEHDCSMIDEQFYMLKDKCTLIGNRISFSIDAYRWPTRVQVATFIHSSILQVRTKMSHWCIALISVNEMKKKEKGMSEEIGNESCRSDWSGVVVYLIDLFSTGFYLFSILLNCFRVIRGSQCSILTI